MRSTPFSNDEFQAAAQMRFGVRLNCLMSSTDLPLKSNSASAIDKFVGAFGSNIKTTTPRGGPTPPPRRAQPLLLLSRSNPPH